MPRSWQVAIFAFLAALAVQARVLSSGNLTPWWPAAIGLVSGAAFFLFKRRVSKVRSTKA